MKHTFLITLLILTTECLHAQGPPINTDTPIMLGLGGRGIRTFFKLVRKETLLDDGDETENLMENEATSLIWPVAPTVQHIQ